MKKSIYDPAYRELVAKLRAARIRQGLRQEDLARQVGVSRTWLGKVERCELRLDILQTVRIGRALGLNVTKLTQRLYAGGRPGGGGPQPFFCSYQRRPCGGGPGTIGDGTRSRSVTIVTDHGCTIGQGGWKGPQGVA